MLPFTARPPTVAPFSDGSTTTFLTGGMGGVQLICNPDGTFKTSQALPPSICEGRSECPELGGEGTWKWDAQTLELHLRELISATWITEQVWKLDSMDRETGNVQGAKLVKASGKKSEQFPIPKEVDVWYRQE